MSRPHFATWLPMTNQTIALNRCYWRSRRGLLELDLLLPPFVQACFATLTQLQRDSLDALLDCEDPDLWAWFQQRGAPDDPGIAELIDLIRAFNDRRGSAD